MTGKTPQIRVKSRARYFGKVCALHPELKGERVRSPNNSQRCPKCSTQKVREWMLRTRREVLTAMGGHCSLCGVDDFEVLVIDHIHGGGNADRIKQGGTKHFPMHVKIRKMEDTSAYRLLCFNCNMKAHYHMKRTGTPLMDRVKYRRKRRL